MKDEYLFDQITIIGLGLIGSSIARAVHKQQLAETIVGCDSNEIPLAFARKHQFIDKPTQDPATAVAGSSLVILASSPSSLGEIAQAIAPKLRPGAIVMDVCSVKEPAIAAIAPHLPPGVEFIPAHPIAGSEQSGVSAGREDLFKGKTVIVTPDRGEHTPALQVITKFWKALGARIEAMPPHLHDMIYAYVSHLPQLLAFAGGPLVPYQESPDKTLQKFLRLSHALPALWVEICVLNKNNILKSLDRYLDVISHIRSELAQAPEPSTEDEALARTKLFPRIAASCLATTVMEAGKQAGFSFARYGGTGFADFTAPAAESPETDIERISGHYKAVGGVLDEYIGRLKSIRRAVDRGESAKIEKALAA